MRHARHVADLGGFNGADSVIEAEVMDAGLRRGEIFWLRKTCGTRVAEDLATASRYIDRRGASSRAGELVEARWRSPLML